jgi:hypothetical protein
MYRDGKEMYAFMSYIKPELERLSESNEIMNMNNVMAYYNKQVQGQLEDFLEMSSRAYSHCKWMKSILKDFEKLWEQASVDVENHEQLIEQRREFIDELVEAKKTRNEEFYELINESSMEWKTEFKK